MINARRLISVTLATLCTGAGALAFTGAPAQAAAPSVIGSFGPGGLSSGAFGDPRGVAVDQSTGAVYVYDTNEEFKLFVYKFNAAGEPEDFSALGTNVIEGAGEGYPEFAQIAVDSSSGDIYVTEGEQVTVYGEEGDPLGELNSGVEAEGGHWGYPCGVAVDPAGNVYVALYEGYVNKYTASGNPVSNSDYESSLSGLVEPCDIAADSAGDVYVAGFSGGVTEYQASEFNTEEKPPLFSAEIDPKGTSVAVDPSSGGDVYIDEGSDIAVYSSSGAPVESFGELNGSFGIAVNDSSGNIYFTDPEEEYGKGEVVIYGVPPSGPPTVDGVSSRDLTTTETELQAQIDPHGVATTYVFQYATTPISGAVSCTGGPSSCTEVPIPPGQIPADFGAQSVSVTVKGLQPGTAYYYRILASNADGKDKSAETFDTFTSLPTAVAGLPDGRAWEMVSPLDKNGAVPSGMSEGGSPIQASEAGGAIVYDSTAPLPADGESEGYSGLSAQVLSVRDGVDGWVSQDITPPVSYPAGIVVGNGPDYRLFSSDLALGLVRPVTGGNRLAEPPLSPALVPGEVQEKTLSLRDDAPLAPEESEAGSYATAKRNGELMGNPGFLALADAQNAPAGVATAESEVEGATPNLAYGVLDAEVQGATLVENPYEEDLYEWSPGGELSPVSVLPGETSEVKGVLGGGAGEEMTRHAISNDGALVFWTESNHYPKQNLYVRDTETQETLQLDTVQGGSGSGVENPFFWTASAEGSKVFFTDEQQFTAGSKAEGGKADLYESELTSGAGKPPVGTLSDLAPGGEVQGVLGASEDGSYVYFVADGVLGDGAERGATQGTCKESGSAGETCSLYEYHDGATTFIATLSEEDAATWGESEGGRKLTTMTSRVSPDGQYVAFMSDRPLTGYDNIDANSGVADEEVFLYQASGERLVCASCDPSGARPEGEEAIELPEHGEGVDASRSWVGRWLAGSVPGWTPDGLERALYQSRYLSDSGRLFFNSPDHLVPLATGDKEKVYEYEPSGVGSCALEAGCVGLISPGDSEHEASFLAADGSGSEVFFLTSERLVPQDTDSARDVYVAHECTGASPCPPPAGAVPPACTTAESCRAAPASQPEIFGAPPSQTFSGAGNIAASVPTKTAKSKRTAAQVRAEKLAKALKACKKKVRHAKREQCEKKARAKYGPVRKKLARKKKSGRS